VCTPFIAYINPQLALKKRRRTEEEKNRKWEEQKEDNNRKREELKRRDRSSFIQASIVRDRELRYWIQRERKQETRRSWYNRLISVLHLRAQFIHLNCLIRGEF
jgi:hypothetical protein